MRVPIAYPLGLVPTSVGISPPPVVPPMAMGSMLCGGPAGVFFTDRKGHSLCQEFRLDFDIVLPQTAGLAWAETSRFTRKRTNTPSCDREMWRSDSRTT